MVNRDEDRGEGQQILVCFTTFLDVQTLNELGEHDLRFGSFYYDFQRFYRVFLYFNELGEQLLYMVPGSTSLCYQTVSHVWLLVL